jgi:TolB-like protein/DNA-binding winged helix-turn-helix (wHTH) protein/Tfp pilus assembly protein PilF
MAKPHPAPGKVVRFGPFELDLESGELLKEGVRIKLQDQPFQILCILLEKPGRVVSREELKNRVWPSDTFVEFDQGVYSAIRRLRDALCDSAESPRYVETLARRGYRFIAPVDSGNVLPIPTERPRLVASPPAQRRQSWIILGAVSALVLFVASLSWLAWRHFKRHTASSPHTSEIRTLAVLPLENLSHDPEQEYFADGMADELVTQLGQISAVRVISRTSAMHYKGTQKTLPEIARELHVDAVVEGSVQRSGKRVRINVQLIEAATDQHLWARSYERDLSDTLVLQSEVAQEIVREIAARLTPEEQSRLTDVGTVDPQAQDDYLLGRYYWNKWSEPDLRKAIGYFKQAIARDPNYARAYAGLAEAYRDLGDPYHGGRLPVETLPQAKVAAMKALELDSSLAEAHGALASIFMLLDWNWAEAEKHYELEVQLSPSYAKGHFDYSRYLQALGRNDEARIQLDQAIELDPLSVEYRNELGFLALTSRDYDRAIEQFRTFGGGGWNVTLAWAYMLKGMYPEAVTLLEARERELGPDPNLLSFLAEAYGGAGRKSDAENAIREMLKQAKVHYVSPCHIAGAYIGLQDKNHVLAWLERGFDEHDEVIIWVQVAPDLDLVRSEPRFQALLRRMNFPEQ